MKLFLLRHGHAAKTSPDASHCLTSHGKTEVQLVGNYFKKHKIKIASAWHSPKTRAIETVRLFLEASGNHDADQEEKKTLRPDGDVQGIMDDLALFQGPSLVLVTHLPFVADLAQQLALDQEGTELAFPTAGVASFERRGGGWKWLWSLDPSTLK